jgi:[ribosomal protein S5]-alanine N-acetyltransferase
MVMPGNTGAYQFWKKVISQYTNHDFTEYKRNVKHFNNSEKNIFRFTSIKN